MSVLAPASVSCRLAVCPPPALSQSIIALEAVPGGGEVRGVVLAIKDGRALASARVRLSPGQVTWHAVSDGGRFLLRSGAGTAATLEVRARGYDGVSAAIPARADSAVAVVAALAAARAAARRRECAAPGSVSSDSVD